MTVSPIRKVRSAVSRIFNFLSILVSQISNFLSILGGADPDVLKHARSERNTFIGLGLVMLGTAFVAALSMMFALRNAVLVVVDPQTGAAAASQPGSRLAASIVLGLLWGALILVLDRALIKTMQGIAGWWRATKYAFPRIVLALFIGVVVSTPITLQIFHSEVSAEVKAYQDDLIRDSREAAENGSTKKDLTAVDQQIEAQQKIVNEGPAGLTSPELEQAKTEYAAAEAKLKSAKEAREQAEEVYICEQHGQSCGGRASGVPGNGPAAIKRGEELTHADGDVTNAETEKQKAQDNLTAAQDAVREANKEKTEQAVREANIALCGSQKDSQGKAVKDDKGHEVKDPGCQGGLIAERDRLSAQLEAEKNGDLIRNSSGLLFQIIALHRLGSKGWTPYLSQKFVAGLFISIELLPVIIKVFIAAKGVTQYDRIARKLQDDEYDRVETTTDRDQEQRNRETRREKAIRDDMLDREIELGRIANAHVAKEMEEILKRALSEWSSQVKNTAAASPAQPGSNRPSTARSTSNGLPDGSKI